MTVKERAKKRIAIITVICMILTLLPTSVLGLEASDVSNHWAKDKIMTWMEQGLIKGYEDGTFKPDNNISRAEFMSLVNGAFNYADTALANYVDVNGDAWYANAIAKAVAAGYISGYPDNTMRPNNPISRAEAAAIIMKVSKLQANSNSTVTFSDSTNLGWSKDAVNAVSDAKVMNGYPDGTFRPQEFIKRAEAVVAIDKALNYSRNNVTYTKAGTYGPETGILEIDGSVMVTEKGTILQNMNIKGDLIISKNVGDGNITLKNVTVKGETTIYGGGQNSIIIIDSTLGKVTISKEDGKIRIVISGTTTVKEVYANSGVKLEEKDLTVGNEGFNEITLNASGDDVIILVGTFDQVDVNAEGIEIQIPKGTTVENLILNEKVNVTGTGTITNADVNVSGVTFETAPKKTDVATGVSAPTAGTTAPTAGGGGGGGGTSGPTTSNLTEYSAALAAVDEVDYTTASWDAYQLIVADNTVTTQDTQTDVDAATAAIIAAQADLVNVAVLTEYNAALAAVDETDYTTASWDVYQLIVAENTVTTQDTQTDVDAATAAIIAAQADLVEVAVLTEYNAALAAVDEADYTTASWDAYQLIVTDNVVTDQDTQADVDDATLAITTAQADLVEVVDLSSWSVGTVANLEIIVGDSPNEGIDFTITDVTNKFGDSIAAGDTNLEGNVSFWIRTNPDQDWEQIDQVNLNIVDATDTISLSKAYLDSLTIGNYQVDITFGDATNNITEWSGLDIPFDIAIIDSSGWSIGTEADLEIIAGNSPNEGIDFTITDVTNKFGDSIAAGDTNLEDNLRFWIWTDESGQDWEQIDPTALSIDDDNDVITLSKVYLDNLTIGSYQIDITFGDDANDITEWSGLDTPFDLVVLDYGDATPPVFVVDYPAVVNITPYSFDLEYKVNKTATVYYVWFESGTNVTPEVDGVIAGTDGSGNQENMGWGYDGLVYSEELGSCRILEGVDPHKTYDIFLVAVDESGNKSPITKLTFESEYIVKVKIIQPAPTPDYEGLRIFADYEYDETTEIYTVDLTWSEYGLLVDYTFVNYDILVDGDYVPGQISKVIVSDELFMGDNALMRESEFVFGYDCMAMFPVYGDATIEITTEPVPEILPDITDIDLYVNRSLIIDETNSNYYENAVDGNDQINFAPVYTSGFEDVMKYYWYEIQYADNIQDFEEFDTTLYEVNTIGEFYGDCLDMSTLSSIVENVEGKYIRIRVSAAQGCYVSDGGFFKARSIIFKVNESASDEMGNDDFDAVENDDYSIGHEILLN